MKISVFILIGFIVILSLFSVTTYINFQLSEQVHENTTYLGLSTQIVREANRFQRNTLNMVSGLHGFLFTAEPYFIQAYDSAVMENKEILKELEILVPKSRQYSILKEMDELNQKWINEYASPLIAAKKNSILHDSSQADFNKKYKSMVQSSAEATLNKNINSLTKAFINYEYGIRENRKDTLEKSIERTRTLSVALTTFSIIAGFIIAIFLAQSISRRIMKMVKMANTIASGNYEVYTEDSGKDELSKLASSLNHMAKVLSEYITLLKRKNTELDQFAHIVSHDMKAPLRGIDNLVTWIEEDHWPELSPKVKEYVGLIRTRIIRGENLINGILSYSRVGQYSIEKEVVNVGQILQDISEGFARPSKLNIKIQPNMPVFQTEKVPLLQVFNNLISNAIKYNDKSVGEIEISCKENNDHFLFVVADNGPGIASQYHDKIFKIFQTLNGNSFENTGVGLAIVKKILDDRKQTITIQSEPGKGSVFSFSWQKY
jgi:signal transduction histidine kinase